MVSIARFQCRGDRIGKTFSMLPWQLIPYHLYTVETVLKALLLWREYCRDEDASGTAYQAEQGLPGDGQVTSWQLRKWLLVIRHGLLAAHSDLAERYDFSGVPSCVCLESMLGQVHAYLESFSRGPPVRMTAVFMALRIYCQISDRFMFGRSSQSRTDAR